MPAPRAALHSHAPTGPVRFRSWRVFAVLALLVAFMATVNVIAWSHRQRPFSVGRKALHPPLLSGAHPHHFPLYWEDDERVAYALTSFEKDVLAAWRDRHDEDVFNYRVGGPKEPLLTRELGGRFGMLAQAALGRGSKRSQKRKRLTSVTIPVDPTAFNFRLAKGEEVLGRYDVGDHRVARVPLQSGLALRDQKAAVPDEANLLIINANPMCPYHFLLVPQYGLLHPQALTEASLLLALAYAGRQSSEYFRLIFNSVGAGSSVNHHHWQGIYLRHGFPIEARSLTPLHTCGAVRVHEVADWPLRAYVLAADAPTDLARAAMAVVTTLQGSDIAHNLLVLDGGRRVLLVPRTIGYFPDVRKLQVAACEVLGLWVVPNQEEYDSLHPEQAEALLAAARPPDAFDVVAIVKAAAL
eukprot:TRINITY_DN25142_c0_g1_i1.p1 TRINITY_DN25142_c0_g1~~TRINITY_DN25142_c0_g1_i1.p1  ORF type:complete len:412 (+),score=96.40 TRINITY_DN25142_c0_g1_i1:97-1332(+)